MNETKNNDLSASASAPVGLTAGDLFHQRFQAAVISETFARAGTPCSITGKFLYSSSVLTTKACHAYETKNMSEFREYIWNLALRLREDASEAKEAISAGILPLVGKLLQIKKNVCIPELRSPKQGGSAMLIYCVQTHSKRQAQFTEKKGLKRSKRKAKEVTILLRKT